MFIETVTIQGFKSYRDQTTLDPFSPETNVIVGRNGSGKSNFFFAIRFVLGDVFSSKISLEERASLLNEGGVGSGYVEIVFNNEDGRFPMCKDRVYLRRTVGMKKDDYSLDRKSVTRSEVMNLLQSAGFSKSNPYYIVPQGRITFLTNASDRERMGVLEEVAGTRVYEEHRNESLKIIEETEGKRKKIEELMKHIEERLEELEDEKKELREYYELEGDRKSLEYVSCLREIQEMQRVLDELQNYRKEDGDRIRDIEEEFRVNEERIKEIEGEREVKRDKLRMVQVEKKQIEEDLNEMMREIGSNEMMLKDLMEEEIEEGERERMERRLEELNEKLMEREEEMSVIRGRIEEESRAENELVLSLSNDVVERDGLMGKMNRGKQFKSVEERNEYLREQMKSVMEAVEQYKEQDEKLGQQIENIREKMKRLNEVNVEYESKLKRGFESEEDRLNEMKKRRDELMDERKGLWKNQVKLETNIKAAKEEIDKLERQLVNKNIMNIEKLVKKMNIKGYHGPLFSLMKVEEEYEIAVDIVAGNSLFYLVVETDQVATSILELSKTGRVTFMPLNRMNKQEEKIRVENTIPLIETIKFEPKYKAAFEHVFSNTLVTENIQMANLISKEYKVNTITRQGDRVDKRGSITGGYFDKKNNRISLIKRLNLIKEKLVNFEIQLNQTNKEIMNVESEINKLTNPIQLEENRIEIERNLREPLIDEINCNKKEINQLEDLLNQKYKSKNNINLNINNLLKENELLNVELNSSKLNLNNKEINKLKELNNLIEIKNENLNKILKEKNDLILKRSNLENSIKIEIFFEKEKIEKKLLKNKNKNLKIKINKLNENLLKLNENSKKFKSRLKILENEIEDYENLLFEINSEFEKLKFENEKILKQFDENSKSFDLIYSKRSTTLKKIDELNKKIRELGSVNNFEKFKDLSKTNLIKQLSQTNEKLKKYSHAFDQFSNFTKQEEILLKRKNELDNSEKSIKDFISTLDKRKNDAIQKTFTQISKSFSEIFEKLVPSGFAQLISDKGNDDVIFEIGGLAVRVSFTSKSDQGLLIQQLSGGQKSLVALAFILAIQSCDPAPFYLFDEIDANLDAVYRSSAANLINELSKNAQFIITTFRPEFLNISKKFYGVTFNNKISQIKSVSKHDALEFVETELKLVDE